MKKLPQLFSTSILILTMSASIFASEIVKVKLFDGETLTGKLWLPTNDRKVKQVVIFVHGTGPDTYLGKRKVRGVNFNYYDLFGEEFNRRGIAFFSYNKRGVEINDKPPTYQKIDREKFKKVVPSVEVKDLSRTIKILRKDKRLKKAKIVLLGWSEGTVIASMLAENKKNKISALLLAGYVHENMFGVIKWQHSGASSMVNLAPAFDKNKDGSISRDEYHSEDRRATTMRTRGLGNAKFEQIDVNKDNFINAADFKIIVAPKYKAILEKTKAGDDDWIWKNYFKVSTNWLNEHFELEANKTRLLRLRLPIYIFHGKSDASTPVDGVYSLRESFGNRKKGNLRTYIFDEHNHDLNFLQWAIGKKMPVGIQAIFNVSERLNILN